MNLPVVDGLYVAMGGALGAVTRWLVAGRITVWFIQTTGWSIPLGTLFVNVTGSFLLGLFLEVTLDRMRVGSGYHLLITTGFFGAYTTFSTFATETVKLMRQGDWLSAIGYSLITTALCVIGAGAGIWLASRLVTRS